jgi:cation:H+ antiporter
MLLLPIIGLLIGFALLIWSADRFVLGASNVARLFGISPLVVGIVIVGFGTSAPELLVSGIAALDGQPGLAIGNALGSNIANIGLIIGLTALFYPLQVRSRIVRREWPVLLLFMALALALLMDGTLDRLDGILLMSGLAISITWSVYEASRQRGDILAAEFQADMSDQLSTRAALLNLILGLIVLVASSRLLVWSAVEIAHALGISDLIIGLTIVALGTSLPELAASLAAARKGEHDIAIGNIAGSNLFNLLGVMALPGIIAPGAFEPMLLRRDYPVMLLLSVMMWFFASNMSLRRGGSVNRLQGALLLSIYVGYMVLLSVQAGAPG